jgi:hypothetical protein
MKRQSLRIAVVGLLVLTVLSTSSSTSASACPLFGPCDTEVELSEGHATLALNAELAAQLAGDGVVVEDYAWRLRSLCEIRDEAQGACSSTDFRPCPEQPGRVIRYLVLERQPLVRPDGTAPDGIVPAPGFEPGDPAGEWTEARRGCMDITALNPPPSPGEVFRYFQALPLPELTTQQQPPGNGLVGLPVIFYTDSPTTQTFTVDIRGFTVDIVAGAVEFTWHTGDGTDLTSTDPGAPYPDQTVTHDYASGTYTAYLTTTWGATFSVDGGASQPVPGTTTTEGPAVTFDVLQARPILVNPYD